MTRSDISLSINLFPLFYILAHPRKMAVCWPDFIC